MTTRLAGQGISIPMPHYGATIAPAFTNSVFAATGNRVAQIGAVWFPDRTGSKSIRRVQFRFGAVTKAGGSALTVSLQDVDLVNGPVIRPDGTADQTVAIANADAGFAANAWYRTNTLSADRTVNYGDLLAVVFDYDGAGRLGADTVSIAGLGLSSGVNFPINQQAAFVTLTAGTWAVTNAITNIVLEFSDGTFGTLLGSVPASAVNSHAYNSGSTPDEFAMKITPNVDISVDGLGVATAFATGANAELVLYTNTTATQTVVIDQNATINTSVRPLMRAVPETDWSASTDYYVAIKATTANNVTVYSVDVSQVDFLDLHPGWFGRECTYATRVDAGAWTETTTRRLLAWYNVCSVPTAGGGGGLAANPVRGFVV